MTDLDRLHRVSLYSGGRGCGKTVAACHNVAGAVELAEDGDTILVVLNELRDVNHFRAILEPILHEHRLIARAWYELRQEYEFYSFKKPDRYGIHDQLIVTVKFTSADRYEDDCHGLLGADVMDVSWNGKEVIGAVIDEYRMERDDNQTIYK